MWYILIMASRTPRRTAMESKPDKTYGSLAFRRATRDDVKSLAELRFRQLIDEGGKPNDNINDELEKYFVNELENEDLIIWVAEAGSKIVATAGVCFFQYPPTFYNVTGKVAYVTNVYTRNEFRHQGIATKLMEYVMDEIRKTGCNTVRLHSSEQGRRLYEKMGFTESSGMMSKNLD